MCREGVSCESKGCFSFVCARIFIFYYFARFPGVAMQLPYIQQEGLCRS